MTTSNVYTENMADIMSCNRERAMVLNIMQAWDKDGLTDSFYDEGVKFAFNKNSGYVFLTNDEYQVLMMNGDKLEEYYNSPYEGHEGFLDELFDDYMSDTEAWHIEDAEWLLELKDNQ